MPATWNPGSVSARWTKLRTNSRPRLSSATESATCSATKPLRRFQRRMENAGSPCFMARPRSAPEPRSAGSSEERSIATSAAASA